ncbi:YezD family protein [Clostridium beijerinckii]|uniref:YezD family protein n=1 Tax=Clostridium beijerinckii TaxID=1520 RepID=UPI00232E068E|nr:YezD family protein [Clostridium beijerinckii]
MNINSKEIVENKKLEEILKMVEKIRFGSITLIIQDGVVIQVDKNEKIRMR